MKTYVAVVISEGTSSRSGRREGDWNCYVHEDKAVAVSMACSARRRWEASGHYGPYRVLVGELNEQFLEMVEGRLIPLEQK